MDNENEIEIKFEYDEGSPNPERVFSTIASFLSELNNIDKMLCDTMPIKVTASTYLTRIENGSIKVFLKNQLEKIDDEALENGDFGKVLGKYLKETKLDVMKFLNKKIEEDEKSNEDAKFKKLQQDIYEKSKKYELNNTLKLYKEIPTSVLAKNVTSLNSAFGSLLVNEKIKYKQDGKEIDLKYNSNLTYENAKKEITEKVIVSENKMLLKIKKADYLGESQWQFKTQENKTIDVKILDDKWLKAFQSKEVIAQPNDCLECIVKITTIYDDNSNEIGITYEIIEVLNVVDSRVQQLSIINDSDNDEGNKYL